MGRIVGTGTRAKTSDDGADEEVALPGLDGLEDVVTGVIRSGDAGLEVEVDAGTIVGRGTSAN